MKLRTVLLILPLAGWVAIAGQNDGATTGVGNAPQVQPHEIQAVAVGPAIRVLAEDADAILAQILAIRQQTEALEPDTKKPEAANDGAGISRTIQLDPPTVVNGSPYFQFTDVTDRVAPQQKLSDATRRQVVENFRRSLAARRKATSR